MSFVGVFRINDNVCRFSLDGKYLALALQNSVIVRDAKSSNVVQSFSAVDIIENMDWSPDSEFILSVMYNRALVQVFSLKDPDWKCIIKEGDAGIANTCWSPDSRHILTVSHFNVWISIWSLEGLSVLYIHNLKSSVDPVQEFSQDGKWLAVVENQDDGDCISIFSTTRWQMIKQCPCDGIYSTAGIKWSPSSSSICVWDKRIDQCNVLIVSIDIDVKSVHFSELSLGVKQVAWSPSGQFLALGCYDGKVHILNNITWSVITVLRHNNVLETPVCKVYKEIKIKVSANQVKKCDRRSFVPARTVFELVPDRPISISRLPEDMPRGVGLISFSPCGQLLVTRDDSMPAVLWIWDVKSGRIHTFISHLSPVTDVSWDCSSLRLVSATGTTNICIWTPASGASSVKVPCTAVSELFVNRVHWHPLGKALALSAGSRIALMELTGVTDIS